MATTFRIALSVPSLNSTTATAHYEIGPTGTKAGEALDRLSQLIAGIAGGSYRSNASGQAAPSLALTIDQNKTAATGTVTCASVADGDTVTIGPIVLTAKTGTPSGSAQWKAGVSDTADGVALAACINAHATLSQYVSAASALGVVTVTAIGNALGVLGNALILTSSNNTRLAVVAMASGANDSSSKTYSF